jgi:hypothetical protein
VSADLVCGCCNYLVEVTRATAKGNTARDGESIAVTSLLSGALGIRSAIVAANVDIYASLADHPDLVYGQAELEALLRYELTGQMFTGPIRTRSKLAKHAVCSALGYPVPSSFRRVKPRFPGQDLDVYVQRSDNLQVWNEDLSPTRRYAVIRVGAAGEVGPIRVIGGLELAVFDKTGKLTSKYQANRRAGRSGSLLVSRVDTAGFIRELAPEESLPHGTLASLHPANPPVRGKVLTVKGLHERLLALAGREFAYTPSERLRGEQLHRAACKVLGLGDYADTGQFPDILCQALEVKLQVARTIDLGLVMPTSEEFAITMSPRLRHRDARYLVAYADLSGDRLRIDHIVTSTGADFFSEFQMFGGLVQNRKLQLRLPKGFFNAE